MGNNNFKRCVGYASGLLLIISVLLLSSCTPSTQTTSPSPLGSQVQPTPTNDETVGEGISFGEDAKLPHPYRVQVADPGGTELNSGDRYKYTMTVENTGDNRDTYTLTASSSLGWADLSTIPASLTVAAHSSASFSVTVTVPLSAAWSTQDVIDIAARGLHGSFDGNRTRTTVHCPLNFTDVPLGADINSEAYAIYYVACHKIIAGLPGNDSSRFDPQTYATRTQLAQALVVGFAIKPYTPTVPSFKDVPTSSPAYQYIEAAAHAGVMSGYPDGGFHPNDKVKRGEAVSILVHLIGYPLYIPSVPSFRDVPSSQPDYAPIETLNTKEHSPDLNKCSNGKDYCFRPDDYITRGELSKIIRDMVDHLLYEKLAP